MRDETSTANPSGIVTMGAVMAAVLALAALAYEHSVLKELRARAEIKTAALGHSQETLRSLDGQLQSGTRQLAAMGAKPPEEGQSAQKNRRASDAADRSLEKAKADAQIFLATDPSLRTMIGKVARMQYQSLLGPFFRQQNLSAPQIDQLMNATVETWMQTLAIRPGGGLFPAQEQPSPDVLSSILGADGYQQLLTYQRSVQAVSFAEQVATEAGYGSAPLSPAQQDKIASLISGASDSFQNGKPVNLATVDWGAVLNQAGAAGLSPAQSDALERLVSNQQYNAALQQAVQAHNNP
jgi:hypothetical protein